MGDLIWSVVVGCFLGCYAFGVTCVLTQLAYGKYLDWKQKRHFNSTTEVLTEE